MQFNILTIFPKSIEPYLTASILGRAEKAGHIQINLIDIRKFAIDKHHNTDDTPYGGGPGMVMKIEPIHRALKSLCVKKGQKTGKIILMSAKGKAFDQKMARGFAKLKKLTLICGRYEGVDERVTKYLCDGEVSIGDYVLAGGELAASVVTETTARLLPKVLGNANSLIDESYNTLNETEYPQYTKPEIYNKWSVPKILLSGDHKKIVNWRKNQK